MQAENPPPPSPSLQFLLPPALRVVAALALGACLVATLPAYAGEAPSYAAPQPFTAPTTGTGTVRVVLALMLVLAAVYGAGWVMKRLRQFNGNPATGLQVIGQVGLGARERVVLLRAGDQQLLLGVANGSVRLLCELRAGSGVHATGMPAAASDAGAGPPTAAAAAPATPARPNFRELLLRSLGK
jgi:flagellar protein FliO/FliZ